MNKKSPGHKEEKKKVIQRSQLENIKICLTFSAHRCHYIIMQL